MLSVPGIVQERREELTPRLAERLHRQLELAAGVPLHTGYFGRDVHREPPLVSRFARRSSARPTFPEKLVQASLLSAITAPAVENDDNAIEIGATDSIQNARREGVIEG